MKATVIASGIMALALVWAGREIHALRAKVAALHAERDSAGSKSVMGFPHAEEGTRLPSILPATPPALSLGSKAPGRATGKDSRAATALAPRVQPDGSIVLGDRTLTAAEADALAAGLRRAGAARRNSGPEGASYSAGKATGPPDSSAGGGDSSNAWCPQEQNAPAEWLQLKYGRSVEISEINIHETYATGALAKVSAVLPDGSERVLWEGTEPVEVPPVERVVKVPRGIRSNQIRLTLDTTRIATWQEIDAVEIIGKDGSRQWAAEGTASSYWGGWGSGVDWGADVR